MKSDHGFLHLRFMNFQQLASIFREIEKQMEKHVYYLNDFIIIFLRKFKVFHELCSICLPGGLILGLDTAQV
jgi:hypothetical protein